MAHPAEPGGAGVVKRAGGFASLKALMLSRNRYALKEWGAVCDRLASGEHICLVRKGGLRERRGGFEVEHREFFLFPTVYHEKKEAPPDEVELRLYATVEDDVEVADLELLRRLEGRHAVPWEDVERRFHYGTRKGVHVLALRAYRLLRPRRIPDARAYAGCISWIELAEELPVEHEGPVLNRAEFRKKLESLQAILHG